MGVLPSHGVSHQSVSRPDVASRVHADDATHAERDAWHLEAWEGNHARLQTCMGEQRGQEHGRAWTGTLHWPQTALAPSPTHSRLTKLCLGRAQ